METLPNSVGKQIERLLPHGTRSDGNGSWSWDNIPFWPPDVFAVVATLVERSSAYRHVIGPEHEGDGPFKDLLRVLDPDWQIEMAARAKAWSWGLLSFSPEHRKGEAWEMWLEALKLSLPENPKQGSATTPYLSWAGLLDVDLAPLQEDWCALVVDYADDPVIRDRTADNPGWWAPAMRLLITADAASTGIGFRPREPIDPASPTAGGGQSYPTWVQLNLHASVAHFGGARDPLAELGRELPFITTVTSELVDSSLGAVLPKTRTSPMGCTLRSLTHHLALLPPSGTVEARWRIPGRRPPPVGIRTSGRFEPRPLNLVLIPFPYRISPKSFKSIGHVASDKWGYFHLDQSWLRSDGLPTDGPDPLGIRKSSRQQLTSFVQSLVQAADHEIGGVHGVLFPELALDWDSFHYISRELLNHCGEEFEFVVAGLSQMPPNQGPEGTTGKGPPCNYAAFRGRLPSDGKPGGGDETAPVWDIMGGREKHHRWKLNQSQIDRYGLASQLDGRSNWWEGISVSRRVVEFFEIRDGSSMTVLICEDLARADPCQTVVRAIGPNLVFALLMDGPQRGFRWPAHYAGVLADDPGSTVLTLTSFGLIDRGLVTDETHSRSIALFKDCKSAVRELQLPSGCHALAIRLEAEAKTEHTLDGRGDNEAAYIWRLRQVCPVRGHGERWITG
jgi:hypothetical protein